MGGTRGCIITTLLCKVGRQNRSALTAHLDKGTGNKAIHVGKQEVIRIKNKPNQKKPKQTKPHKKKQHTKNTFDLISKVILA